MPVCSASERLSWLYDTCQHLVNIFLYKAQVMLTITQRESLDDTNIPHTETHKHIFMHMLGLTVNRLLSWPFCLPFFSFLALPVWGVEVGALVFLAERGAWTSATGLTSSCSASCTKWGGAGGATKNRSREYTQNKRTRKGLKRMRGKKVSIDMGLTKQIHSFIVLYEKILCSHVKRLRAQKKNSRCLHPLLDAILIEGDKAAVRATVKLELWSTIHSFLQPASLKAIVCPKIWNSVIIYFSCSAKKRILVIFQNITWFKCCGIRLLKSYSFRYDHWSFTYNKFKLTKPK